MGRPGKRTENGTLWSGGLVLCLPHKRHGAPAAYGAGLRVAGARFDRSFVLDADQISPPALQERTTVEKRLAGRHSTYRGCEHDERRTDRSCPEGIGQSSRLKTIASMNGDFDGGD